MLIEGSDACSILLFICAADMDSLDDQTGTESNRQADEDLRVVVLVPAWPKPWPGYRR